MQVLEEEIRFRLNKMYFELPLFDSPSYSLLGGKSGRSLFDFLYQKYININADNQRLEKSIQEIAENSVNNADIAICGGKTGINWFFAYLFQQEVFEKEDLEIVCDDNFKLTELSLFFLDHGKYDFLHGALGFAYYLLYSEPEKYPSYFDNVFKKLSALLLVHNGLNYIPHYDIVNACPVHEQVDFGLAHGLPSILKFCMQAYKQNICSVEAKRLAYDMIEFILRHINKDTSKSFFCSMLYLNSPKDSFSRMAWCYGDLTVAFILYQAGRTFNDTKLKEDAEHILIATTTRRTGIETAVADAGICHGSAGIAHVYNKMWRYTEQEVFKEACEFWIQKTIDFGRYNDGLAGFKKYDAREEIYEKSSSLLEGAVGTGLVLLSYITGDFSWDYCLMLND